jgi:hypothetical protein
VALIGSSAEAVCSDRSGGLLQTLAELLDRHNDLRTKLLERTLSCWEAQTIDFLYSKTASA